MRTVEVLDLETEVVEWSGPMDEFLSANGDWPLAAEEISCLASGGEIIVGGGAATAFLVRQTQEAV